MSKEFDEFMQSVESLTNYPELQGTMNLCNDIIKKSQSEIHLAALKAWKEYDSEDATMTANDTIADAFFVGWKKAIDW